MGMALANRLAGDGHAVTVKERSDQLGGLATWHNYGDFYWDRFYHVILPSDKHLIGFISELGLGEELEWRRTRTGFYVNEKMHSISSNLEFLKFPYLSIFSKIRLALTMIYCSRIDDWKKLEQEPVEDWLIRISGVKNYEKLWKPLLLAKLGENYKRVSAVFIWSYIKRLFSARDKSASAEHLGHVSGGYKMIFERLRENIERAGGKIHIGKSVTSVRPASNGRLIVIEDDHTEEYDHVICTSPVPVLRKIVSPELVAISKDGADVEYLGVVCAVVVSREPLVPFYVVNIADRNVPFTGVIGMSTVIDTANTGGRNLTYLPKYILSTDAAFQKTDDEFEKEFVDGLRRMLPDFDDRQIESIHINRAVTVQPLQVTGYSKLVPKVATKHSNFFVLNTSQFVNATLNNNEVIGAVNRFYDNHREALIKSVA